MALNALRHLALNLDPRAKPEEDLAYALGILTYFWGYPLGFLARLRRNMTAPTRPAITHGDNTFLLETELKGPGSKEVISPTNDTLDAFAWLDLRQGPVLLRLPEIPDRYYAFQCVDAYTNNFAYLSQLRHGSRPPAVALCPPGWEGSVPWKVDRIPSPTSTACIYGKIQLQGVSDLPALRRLQRQIALLPAVETKLASPPGLQLDARTADSSEDRPLTFFDDLGQLLVANPPPVQDAALITLIEGIGFDRRTGFDATRLAPPVRRGLERAIASAPRILNEKARTAGELVNGWNIFEIGEIFGDDYLFRAISAYITPFAGLFMQEPAEAFFPQAYFDGDEERLDTARWTYTLRFRPDELPPVDGFWSITLYERSTRHLVPNELGRYSILADTEGLRYGADGSLTLYLQHKPPKADLISNWLPAPNAAMYLTLRMYHPRPEAWNGKWAPPPIRKGQRLSAS